MIPSDAAPGKLRLRTEAHRQKQRREGEVAQLNALSDHDRKHLLLRAHFALYADAPAPRDWVFTVVEAAPEGLGEAIPGLLLQPEWPALLRQLCVPLKAHEVDPCFARLCDLTAAAPDAGHEAGGGGGGGLAGVSFAVLQRWMFEGVPLAKGAAEGAPKPSRSRYVYTHECGCTRLLDSSVHRLPSRMPRPSPPSPPSPLHHAPAL